MKSAAQSIAVSLPLVMLSIIRDNLALTPRVSTARDKLCQQMRCNLSMKRVISGWVVIASSQSKAVRSFNRWTIDSDGPWK